MEVHQHVAGRFGIVTVLVFKCHGRQLAPVGRLGLVVKRSACTRKDAGSTPRFDSPFSSKIVIYGHCLVTLTAQLMKQ